MVATQRPQVQRVNIPITDKEFVQMLFTARKEDIHLGGLYDLRGAIITIWERPWADVNAWRYLGKIGELHYQHPSAETPPTIRRIALYPGHTSDELLGHLAHLTGRERKSMSDLIR